MACPPINTLKKDFGPIDNIYIYMTYFNDSRKGSEDARMKDLLMKQRSVGWFPLFYNNKNCFQRCLKTS